METKNKRTNVKVSALPLAVLVLLTLSGSSWPIGGMISYWRFEEGSGNIAYDYVGENDGTIYGAQWTTGIVNGALSFDGVDDQVNGQNQIFPIETVEAWVKINSYPTTYRYGIVAASTGPGGCSFSEILEVDPAGKPSYYHWCCQYGVRRPIGTTSLNICEWYHLAATVQNENEVKLYVNGLLEGSVWAGIYPQQNPYFVFSYTNDCWGYHYSHEHFEGELDEVAIYTRPLTSEEIQQHYQNGLDGMGYCIEIEIDIKPGSYPNSINLGSYGLVPLAILSSADFDARTVNPDTVQLAGAGVAVRGKSNKSMAHDEDVNGDGRLDLVVQIETQNLDPGSFQDGYAVLTGKTYDGLPIEGKDEITIVPSEE